MLVAVVRLRRDPLRLTLSEPFGARLTDAEATGTIINTDALPRAWLARFGRTAAGHMLESVRERLHGEAIVRYAGTWMQRLLTALHGLGDDLHCG